LAWAARLPWESVGCSDQNQTGTKRNRFVIVIALFATTQRGVFKGEWRKKHRSACLTNYGFDIICMHVCGAWWFGYKNATWIKKPISVSHHAFASCCYDCTDPESTLIWCVHGQYSNIVWDTTDLSLMRLKLCSFGQVNAVWITLLTFSDKIVHLILMLKPFYSCIFR
jgi:hypothetical protein